MAWLVWVVSMTPETVWSVNIGNKSKNNTLQLLLLTVTSKGRYDVQFHDELLFYWIYVTVNHQILPYSGSFKLEFWLDWVKRTKKQMFTWATASPDDSLVFCNIPTVSFDLHINERSMTLVDSISIIQLKNVATNNLVSFPLWE